MGNIVQFNEAEIKAQLGEMVRKTVENTLNTIVIAIVRRGNNVIYGLGI